MMVEIEVKKEKQFGKMRIAPNGMVARDLFVNCWKHRVELHAHDVTL